MQKTKFYNLINIVLVVIFLISSGCSRKISIKDYSQKLKISFPADMELVFYEFKNDFQDYSTTSIYKLTFNQKNILLDEIIENMNDTNNNSKWHNCNEYYSYKYEDKNEGISINIMFIAKNELSTLSIREVKI